MQCDLQYTCLTLAFFFSRINVNICSIKRILIDKIEIRSLELPLKKGLFCQYINVCVHKGRDIEHTETSNLHAYRMTNTESEISNLVEIHIYKIYN